MSTKTELPNFGIDAPAVLRNLFLFGTLCLVLGLFGPRALHLGKVNFLLRPMFFWTGIALLLEGCLYLLYVKHGKFRHRDFMLGLHQWQGDEQVLDVGCGRGLLLAGAAKRLNGGGHATGVDIWSNVDMGGNSEAATRRNLVLEGIEDRCSLISIPVQEMPFPSAGFDVIVSNLCLHNIPQRRERDRALAKIADTLKPGGIALLSDYKNTGQYAETLHALGLEVEFRRGSFLTTFPPLRVVLARRKSELSV